MMIFQSAKGFFQRNRFILTVGVAGVAYAGMLDYLVSGPASKKVAETVWHFQKYQPQRLLNRELLEEASAQIRASLSEDKERKRHRNNMKEELHWAQYWAHKRDLGMVTYHLNEAAQHATAAGEMDTMRAAATVILHSGISLLHKEAQKHADNGDRELMESKLKQVEEWLDFGRRHRVRSVQK